MPETVAPSCLSLFEVDLSVLYLSLFLLRLSSAHEGQPLDLNLVGESHSVSVEALISFMNDVNASEKLTDKVQHDVNLVMLSIRKDSLKSTEDMEKGLTHLLLEIFELTSHTPLGFDRSVRCRNSITVSRRIKGFVQGIVHRLVISLPTKRVAFSVYAVYIALGLKGVTNHHILSHLHRCAIACMKIVLHSLRIPYSRKDMDTGIGNITDWDHKHTDPKASALYYVSRAYSSLPCENTVEPCQDSKLESKITYLTDLLLDMNVVLSTFDSIHLPSSSITVPEAFKLPRRVLESVWREEFSSQCTTISARMDSTNRCTIDTGTSCSGSRSSEDRKLRRVGSSSVRSGISDDSHVTTPVPPLSLAIGSGRVDSGLAPVPKLNLTKVMQAYELDSYHCSIDEDLNGDTSSSIYSSYYSSDREAPVTDTDRSGRMEESTARATVTPPDGPAIPPLQLQTTAKKYNRNGSISTNRSHSCVTTTDKCPKQTLLQEAFLARLTLEHSRMIQMMEDNSRMFNYVSES